jgi:hypothetical protein
LLPFATFASSAPKLVLYVQLFRHRLTKSPEITLKAFSGFDKVRMAIARNESQLNQPLAFCKDLV